MLLDRETDKEIGAINSTFPQVRGRDLMFDPKTMPQDFQGERNLVILAFRMRHQSLVNTWLPFATSWTAQDEGFRFYEVPVIQYMLPIYHDFIDHGMANGIRDPEALRRTFTVYTNLSRFTRQLGLETTNDITTLLIDGEGQILAAVQGPYTKKKGEYLWDAAQQRAPAPVSSELHTRR